MAPVTGHDDGEEIPKTVFIDTSLDTHLATIVSHSDTVSDLKEKILLEHRQCFPAIGEIKIHCLKVKRRGNFYHLSDSLLVKSAFGATKKNWFVSVDASRVEQHVEVQNLSRPRGEEQLALPWVTDNRSGGRHDFPADKPSKPSLVNGSSSIHPQIVPFVNHKVLSVDQLTSGESCKDVSKNMVEDRSSTDNHWRNREQDLEKFDTIIKETKSKKRVLDVHNEGSVVKALESGPSAKKKRRSQRIELTDMIKASEGDVVLTHEINKVNVQNSVVEHKSESKNVTLDGVATEPLSDEHTRTMSHSQKTKKKMNRINKDNDNSGHDQLVTVVPTNVGDVGEETLPQINTEASEVRLDGAMVVETSIQQETPVGMTQSEECNELVQKAVIGNDIPYSTMKTSDCEPQVKLPERSKRKKAKKPAAKNKGESVVKHLSVPNPVFEDKIIDERKNDDKIIDDRKNDDDKIIDERKNDDDKINDERNNNVVSLSPTERNEVSEKKIIDDSLVYASKKSDNLIVKEVEIAEPTETNKNHLHAEVMEGKSKKALKDNVGSKKKKKDVAKPASINDETGAKEADNAATGTNPGTLLPHSERKENIEIASNNDNLVGNGAEISRTETNRSQVNAEDINDKMDSTKKNKRKKKTKKSVARNDNEPMMKHANDPSLDVNLHETVKEGKINVPDNEKNDIPKENLSDNKYIEHQPLPEETSKHMKESKTDNHNIDSQVDIPKDGSSEVDFKNYFVPSQQQNEIPSMSEKKPKKKTEGAVLSQKSISKRDNKKDSNFPNADQYKTPKKTKKIEPSRPSKSAHASKQDDEPSSESISRSLGQTHVKIFKKTTPVTNNSKSAKSLLNKPGVMFDDGSDDSSADDNASVDSGSSTQSPSGKSSSSGESDSSIDSKRNGSYGTKRKGSGGKNDINSQSRMKSVSMMDLLRSSSRFKKAKNTASQQMVDTESQPVDYVPESQPTAKR